MQAFKDLRRHFLCRRMTSGLQKPGDLFDRGRLRCLSRGVALQEDQAGSLLQFAKERERHRVIGFETGGELVDQPGLHLDQARLVAGECFEFGHRLAIGQESMQIGEVGSSRFGEQVGVNRIGCGLQKQSDGDLRCAD